MVRAINAADLRTIDNRLVAFGTRNAYSETQTNPQRGVFPARDWIKGEFEKIAASSGGRMTVSLDTFVQPKEVPRNPRDVVISSVIATLRGDDPNGRTEVLSSHYDSRNSDGFDPLKDAPGADDNGSGVSCVLAAARAMAPHHFHGTIIFAAYDGEEQGLFGSAHHAKTLREAGVNVDANLNNDIIGASVGHGGERTPFEVRLFSEALPPDADLARTNLIGSENDSPSRELARFVASTGAQYVPQMHAMLIFRSDRFLRGGDQQSFAAQGFPAVRFVEVNENYNHQHQDVRVENGLQYGDLQRYMDFNYLARVTQMNVAALAALALGPGSPKNTVMLTKTLSYDTTLRWDAVPGATGYEVVYRRTNEATWTGVRSAGNATQVRVPFSKDNMIFGVRAVDAQGHRSVAVYPQPVKE